MSVFIPEAPEQETLMLASVRRSPDWERLIESGTTPALVVGGERRLKRVADQPRSDLKNTMVGQGAPSGISA